MHLGVCFQWHGRDELLFCNPHPPAFTMSIECSRFKKKKANKTNNKQPQHYKSLAVYSQCFCFSTLWGQPFSGRLGLWYLYSVFWPSTLNFREPRALLCLPPSPAAIKPASFSDRGEPCVENNACAQSVELQFVIVEWLLLIVSWLTDPDPSELWLRSKTTHWLLVKINSTSFEVWQ